MINDKNDKMDRREALKISGMGIAALLLPSLRQDEKTPENMPRGEAGMNVVRIGNLYSTQEWFYDPAGLYIQKGEKVLWVARKWGASVTAFHPSNDNHELRIPENAKPFDSGVVPLLDTDYEGMDRFEYTFEVEGTYDYYSRYHEVLGMVGRIVVGQPGGPAEKYPPGYGNRDGRAVVYPQQIKLFETLLGSEEIVAKKVIRYPRGILGRPVVVGPHG